jgi:hypothetical protein
LRSRETATQKTNLVFCSLTTDARRRLSAPQAWRDHSEGNRSCIAVSDADGSGIGQEHRSMVNALAAAEASRPGSIVQNSYIAFIRMSRTSS